MPGFLSCLNPQWRTVFTLSNEKALHLLEPHCSFQVFTAVVGRLMVFFWVSVPWCEWVLGYNLVCMNHIHSSWRCMLHIPPTCQNTLVLRGAETQKNAIKYIICCCSLGRWKAMSFSLITFSSLSKYQLSTNCRSVFWGHLNFEVKGGHLHEHYTQSHA